MAEFVPSDLADIPVVSDLVDTIRLSSRWTMYVKIIWPMTFLTVMALPFVVAVTGLAVSPDESFLVATFYTAPTLALCVWLTYPRFRFVDQVWLASDTIFVRNRNRIDQFPVSAILDVGYQAATPEHVIVLLRQPCAFGSRIRFMPLLARVLPGRLHPIAELLLGMSRQQPTKKLDPMNFGEQTEAIQVARGHLPWDAIQS